ncbi:hypothetical protein ACOMHN_003639 [Nucella lapillus]
MDLSEETGCAWTSVRRQGVHGPQRVDRVCMDLSEETGCAWTTSVRRQGARTTCQVTSVVTSPHGVKERTPDVTLVPQFQGVDLRPQYVIHSTTTLFPRQEEHLICLTYEE